MDEHVLAGQKKAAAREMENPPMRWHKFLIFFSLPLSFILAIVHIFQGIGDLNAFSPSLYRPETVGLIRFALYADLVMNGVNLLLILLAEIHLVGQQWRGVHLLVALYLLESLYAVVSLVMLYRAGAMLSQPLLYIAGGLVMAFISLTYYRKRRALFSPAPETPLS